MKFTPNLTIFCHFLPKNCWRHRKNWIKNFSWNFLWFPNCSVNFIFVASFLKILDGINFPPPPQRDILNLKIIAVSSEGIWLIKLMISFLTFLLTSPFIKPILGVGNLSDLKTLHYTLFDIFWTSMRYLASQLWKWQPFSKDYHCMLWSECSKITEIRK